MKLQISTIAKTTYESADVDRVTVPTEAGEITILNRHIPLISLLKPGVVKIIHTDKTEEFLAVSTGAIEVQSNVDEPTKIIILADQADRAGSIDLEVVQKAKERATAALAKPQTLSEKEYKTLIADLAMQEARIKAATRA